MLTEPQIRALLRDAEAARVECKRQLERQREMFRPGDWQTHAQLRRIESRIETLEEVLEGDT